MREVARRWNADGVRTTRGGEWNHTNVRQVPRNPRLAGWRTHRKAIARDASGQPVRGVWQALVDQDTFDALQAALDGRATRSRRGSPRYLLSGVARCGECGSRMHGYRLDGGERHAYACSAEGRGHSLTIAGRQTDELLAALVERRLAEADLSGEPVAADEWAGEARLRAIPGQIGELMSAFQAGVLSGAIVSPRSRPWRLSSGPGAGCKARGALDPGPAAGRIEVGSKGADKLPVLTRLFKHFLGLYTTRRVA
ncbi:recombinase family protein [Nocardioides sp. STR3]|uniref:Recombinase family protein n=1 Tax=Nocardioides pinisoli TaxID=2950279 RepID=A0ABT1KT82_9ACTN|nr:recombinase family protein [Nocardioides pinisoli]